jgi:hypothetical protein
MSKAWLGLTTSAPLASSKMTSLAIGPLSFTSKLQAAGKRE